MPKKHIAIAAALVATITLPAFAQEGPWQVRIRAISVVPDETSTISVIGGEARVKSDVMPELDISYFFSPNWAAELILATTKHDVSARNTAAGDIDVGSVRVLPPTLTLQYHFAPENKFRPYLGAGINYTVFYDDNPAGGVVKVARYKDGFGYAAQAGVDIDINQEFFFNLDVKKLWLNTEVDINKGAILADVDLDPWVLGIGFGYRF